MTKSTESKGEWPAEELERIDATRVGKAGELSYRGLPFMSWPADDAVARDIVIATLLSMGMTGPRITALVGMSTSHVSIVRKGVAKGGVAELARRGKRGPQPRLASEPARADVRTLLERGFTYEQVAKKMGVTSKTLARVRREMGLMKPRGPSQVLLPGVGEGARKAGRMASPESVNPVPPSLAPSAPETPRETQTKSSVVTLENEPEEPEELAPARPLPTGPVEHPTRYAGVMLLLAAMGELGVPEALDAAGACRRDTALYDARQVNIALACAWVAGCASLESMHERDARGLGVVLGLERSPSVRTLHRAIAQIVANYDPIALPRELAKGLAHAYANEPLLFGVDGHHKDYFGKAPIDKGWNTKTGEATKGLGDILGHDLRGTTWATMEVPAGDALSQYLVLVARNLRQTHGEGRPITLAVDRGGFSFAAWNTLAGEGFHYIGWLPATVKTTGLEAIAPDDDGLGEAPWQHPSLTHDARLIVQRDGDRLLPLCTNLPGIVDTQSVVRILRKLRGVEENDDTGGASLDIKSARRTAHIDSLTDRGIAREAPDDRMVKNPARKRARKRKRNLERKIASFEHVLTDVPDPYPEALMLAELQHALVQYELKQEPAKLPRIALEPDAKRAWLKTSNRGLLQPLKYAADNARRWLLVRLDRALAPTNHDYDASALPRTLDALLKTPGHLRFHSDRIFVTLDLQLPPAAHARLDEALRALSGLRMPFHKDHRVLSFQLAPRPTRQTLPHRLAPALATP